MQSLHRGARDVFHLGHGDEVAQVPQFHGAREGMPATHAEARNIVFHRDDGVPARQWGMKTKTAWATPLIILAICLTACSRKAEQAGPPPPTVVVAT